MRMELHKFCHGCNTSRKMNSIRIDDKLSHFECTECGKRNEIGER